jgi:hypothetical protein
MQERQWERGDGGRELGRKGGSYEFPEMNRKDDEPRRGYGEGDC